MPIAATSAPSTDQGWIYELMRWIGVSPDTAHHIQSVLVRPLTVLFIVIVAGIALWVGDRAIRRWIGGAARKAAERADSPRGAARATTITTMLSSIWRGIVLVTAFFVILGTFGIDLTPVLFGATVVAATIGFGAQQLVRDLLAGFLLIMEGQYDIGDTVVVGDTVGIVEDLTLRVTRLRGGDGATVFVANGDIRKLSNRTRGYAQVAVDAPVPAGTGVDTLLEAAAAAARSISSSPALAGALVGPPEVVGIVAADAATITARVSVRVPPDRRDEVERALRVEIARHLRAGGVFADTGAGADADGSIAPGTPPGVS